MVRFRLPLLIVLAACGPSPRPALPAPKASPTDPDGPHRAAVIAQLQPFIDAEIVRGMVVGLYDAGKLEIYGFGTGPNGKPPTGKTLFEIGSITKVYTGLLLADAIQRREVSLDAPVAPLLPSGITVPTRDKIAITLKHLATHTSGLPRIPPSMMQNAQVSDPYAGYGEERLYQDLLATRLEATPGTASAYSNYGAGLLGFALGRKLGGGYATVLKQRVLVPLGLEDTYITVPAGAPDRAQGTDTDLAPVPPWTWDALAGAGALVSTVRDQLKLLDAELEAGAGSRAILRPAMRLSQETQLAQVGANTGLGWQIDGDGRYWHNGGTGGFHAFLGFDPKTRRGVVILASTSTSIVDQLAVTLYQVLDGQPPPAATFPSAAQLAPLAGRYDFGGTALTITAVGKRLYIEGPGEPRHRMTPLTETRFLIEPLQAIATFERDADQVSRLVFEVGGTTLTASRLAPGAAPTPAPTPPATTPAPVR